MNKVILIGRLTRDPDIRYTQDGICCARFSIAVNRRFTKNDHPEADFPNIVAFRKTGEFIEKYFQKGMKIGITGRIQTGSYTNRDGVKVYTTDVIAEEVELVESKKGNQSEQSKQTTPPPITGDEGWMQIPDGTDEELPF